MNYFKLIIHLVIVLLFTFSCKTFHKEVKEEINKSRIVINLLKSFDYDFNNQSSTNWLKEVINTDNEYHRKVLLKQGRCNFDTPPNGLTSEELICLYNYYYFGMHFQSSFWLFNHIWNSGFAVMFIINRDPIFIDLGCGTLASSIAFSQTINQQVNISLFTQKPIRLSLTPLAKIFG
jgi:hypothetical protein